MKRDMDLIREILLEVEKCPSLEGCRIEIPGHSQEEGYFNARLAQEAGLIEAKFLSGTTVFHIVRLTNAGHEFLEGARNDTVWAKAKEIAAKNTGTLTVEALKIALSTLIDKMMR
jgi:hypothetical protein